MLDEFLWGKVARISPEAPVPVVEVTGQSFHLGGAGNVASNVRSLGARGPSSREWWARTRRASGCGRRSPRRESSSCLVALGNEPAHDREDPHRRPPPAGGAGRPRGPTDVPADALERALVGRLARAAERCGALVVSDYQKGVVTPRC